MYIYIYVPVGYTHTFRHMQDVEVLANGRHDGDVHFAEQRWRLIAETFVESVMWLNVLAPLPTPLLLAEATCAPHTCPADCQTNWPTMLIFQHSAHNCIVDNVFDYYQKDDGCWCAVAVTHQKYQFIRLLYAARAFKLAWRDSSAQAAHARECTFTRVILKCCCCTSTHVHRPSSGAILHNDILARAKRIKTFIIFIIIMAMTMKIQFLERVTNPRTKSSDTHTHTKRAIWKLHLLDGRSNFLRENCILKLQRI